MNSLYYFTVTAAPVPSDFRFHFRLGFPPSNSVCTSPLAIAGPSQTISGSSYLATGVFLTMNCFGYQFLGHTLFYSFNSADYNFLTVSLCNGGFITPSTSAAFYLFPALDCGALACLAPRSASEICSNSVFNAVGGRINTNRDYLLAFTLSGNAEFEFSFELSNVIAPTNDFCADAIEISFVSGFFSTDTQYAVNDFTTGCAPSFEMSSNVWYSFNSGVYNTVLVSACSNRGGNSNYDTTLALYTSCSASSCLAFNDDSCSSLASQITAGIARNTNYVLGVGGYFASLGQATFYFELSSSVGIVAPSAIPDTNEGEVAVYRATYAAYTILSGDINWGDGSPATPYNIQVLSSSSGVISGSHIYANDGTYTVTLRIVTTQNGQLTFLSSVVINNLPPVLPATVSYNILAGRIITFQPFVATEPGTLDSVSASVNYGDGSAVVNFTPSFSPFGPPGSATGSPITVAIPLHVYTSIGVFPVTLTLIDDAGASASLTFSVKSVAVFYHYAPYVINWIPTPTASVSDFVDIVLSDGSSSVVQNVNPIPELLASATIYPSGFKSNIDLTLSVRRRSAQTVLLSGTVRLSSPESYSPQ